MEGAEASRSQEEAKKPRKVYSYLHHLWTTAIYVFGF